MSYSLTCKCVNQNKQEPLRFEIIYYRDGQRYSDIVDENTARLLEIAKKAGKHERSKELLLLLNS